MPLSDEQKAKQKAARAVKRDAHNRRVGIVRDHAGEELAYAVRTLWKDASFTDWPTAVAAFAEGLTVTIGCYAPNPAPGMYGTWHKHKIRLNPDGSIDLLSHPGHVVDAETEMFLAALGAPMCQCVAAAVHLPGRTLVPRSVMSHANLNRRVRALHAAVAWAQVPDHEWSPEFGDTYLRYGVTPAAMSEWDAAGWDREQALVFQQHLADVSVANAWREAGQVTQRAAMLAGRGEYPNEEERWARAGFTASRSAKWRTTGMSPEQAFEWDRHNVAPQMVEYLVRADRANRVPLDTAKQWCASGIPSSDVLSWFDATGGDLDVALQWHRAKVKPGYVSGFLRWNQNRPGNELEPVVVRPYRVAYFPDDPAVIADAIASGVEPGQYKAAVDSLVAALDEPNRLARALTTHRPATEREWAWPDLRNERWYLQAVKRVKSGYSPNVTKFIVNWLVAERSRSVVGCGR